MRYRTRYTLKQWRRHRELSQTKLAKAVGVSRSTIARWEDEKCDDMPNAKCIPKLEQALDIRWSDDVKIKSEAKKEADISMQKA